MKGIRKITVEASLKGESTAAVIMFNERVDIDTAEDAYRYEYKRLLNQLQRGRDTGIEHRTWDDGREITVALP